MRKQEKINFLKEHFHYEVEKLCTSLKFLIRFQLEKNENGEMLALECFLLHFRNLVEFLYFDKSQKHPDDARSLDFIQEKQWDDLKLSYNNSLKKLYDRACKEISHLTYSRFYGTPPEKEWICSDLFKIIEKDIEKFLNYLPNDYNNIKSLIHKYLDDINKKYFST